MLFVLFFFAARPDTGVPIFISVLLPSDSNGTDSSIHLPSGQIDYKKFVNVLIRISKGVRFVRLPQTEAPTRLQLEEAPSLATWRLRHLQEVCSTAGPAMEGGDASRQIGDRRSKGDYTKTGDGRNQTDSRCSDQIFTGNHLDDARGSDFGVFTDFQEMFWETIR